MNGRWRAVKGVAHGQVEGGFFEDRPLRLGAQVGQKIYDVAICHGVTTTHGMGCLPLPRSRAYLQVFRLI
jgi:hypothetical protein